MKRKNMYIILIIKNKTKNIKIPFSIRKLKNHSINYFNNKDVTINSIL